MSTKDKHSIKLLAVHWILSTQHTEDMTDCMRDVSTVVFMSEQNLAPDQHVSLCYQSVTWTPVNCN